MIIYSIFQEVVTFTGIPVVHFVLEIILIILILVIWKTKIVHPRENRLYLSKEDEDVIIEEWTPDPLVPEKWMDSSIDKKEISGKFGHYVSIADSQKLNLATTNFLDFVGNLTIEKNAISIISEYAVGTCGPRGFYGTTDIHLKLEEKLAQYFGVEEAIIYSFGLATFSSAIPAYCKKHDIIFADEGVGFSAQIGISASRSKVYWFKHNDIDDLEKCLMLVETAEKSNPRKFKNVRKFIVIESIYANSGDMVDLRRIIEFKYRFKVRIFLDESFSIGILGDSGRGITEHLEIDVTEIDLISFSFEHSFASTGGACIGTSYVINHQRLSGLGYCYSASSPAFLCQVVIDELEIIKQNNQILFDLHSISKSFHSKLSRRLNIQFRIDGSYVSPMLHIRLDKNPIDSSDFKYQHHLIDNIIKECYDKNILLLNPCYVAEKERKCPPPSIRICLNCALTPSEISRAIEVICNAIDKHIDSF